MKYLVVSLIATLLAVTSVQSQSTSQTWRHALAMTEGNLTLDNQWHSIVVPGFKPNFGTIEGRVRIYVIGAGQNGSALHVRSRPNGTDGGSFRPGYEPTRHPRVTFEVPCDPEEPNICKLWYNGTTNVDGKPPWIFDMKLERWR